jgi:hypothetical protein
VLWFIWLLALGFVLSLFTAEHIKYIRRGRAEEDDDVCELLDDDNDDDDDDAGAALLVL